MRSLVRKSKAQNFISSLNNQILEKVCSYKYLGFTLDEYLNFNRHIKEMKQLVTHKLYLLSKIRKYITVDACIIIFKTMIPSLFEYRDLVYNGTSQKNLDDIEKLFYRGLRIYVSTQTMLCLNMIFVLYVRYQHSVTDTIVTYYCLCIHKNQM